MGAGGNIGRAGELTQKISVETVSVATASTGNRTESWGEFAQVWAKIEHTSGGGERFDNERISPDVPLMVTIRRLAGLTSKMRLKMIDRFDGDRVRYFNIVSIQQNERHTFTFLGCSEKP